MIVAVEELIEKYFEADRLEIRLNCVARVWNTVNVSSTTINYGKIEP